MSRSQTFAAQSDALMSEPNGRLMTKFHRLDNLLNRSAPGRLHGTARLEHDLVLLSREARGGNAPRRRPTPVMVGAGVSSSFAAQAS